MKAGKVYFISAPGRIKIGYTTQPEVRLAHLQAVDMERLDVIGTADGSRDDEAGLHRKLEQYQLRGEWFADNEEVRGIISLFLEGKLKFAQRRYSSKELSEPDPEVSVRVARAALAELRSVGDEIMARAARREPVGDLVRIVKFLSEQVVAPLLYPERAEIAPEIVETK
jgi:hypothetical protein